MRKNHSINPFELIVLFIIAGIAMIGFLIAMLGAKHKTKLSHMGITRVLLRFSGKAMH